MYYADKTVRRLKESKEIVIYGARIVATEVAHCLMGNPYHLSIKRFIVSDKEGNPERLLGIPVIDLEEAEDKHRDATVVVAVMEKYLDEIIETLQKKGFQDIIPLSFESDLWSEIRGNYYRELCKSQGIEYLTLEEELSGEQKSYFEAKSNHIRVYMAKCHVDRAVSEDLSKYDWEVPIQVGASLTEKTIAEIRDNQGANISQKNREYCELTALYWIWKNNKSKYAGLCHYRRHFLLNKEELEILAESDIDVVLTIPILNFPSVREAYIHDHAESDWDIMLEAIEVLHPDYRGTAERLQNGVFYYAYNMFIARKEILDEYCSWLFPVLTYCEDKIGRKEDVYQNRYIGFLAERLLSIYFLHNQDKLKIVHARKHFIDK